MKFGSSWYFLCVFLVIGAYSQVPQPWDNCTAAANHTMCRFFYPGPGLNCQTPFDNNVPDTLRSYIVDLHNSRRARVASGIEARGVPGPQPTAANMSQVRWNPVLATVAQRWADQCSFGSDAVRNANIPSADNSTYTVQYVGQNVFGYLDYNANVIPIANNPQPNYWLQAINSWYNEVQSFSSVTVGNYSYNERVGKYTQLVWGQTTDIGCGFSRFRYDANRIGRLLVCNYGIGGNRAGFPVYNTGASCSSCGAAGCSGSLCRVTQLI